MIKRLYKWQLYLIAFVIAFIFFVLGAVLGTFLYMKNIDMAGIKEDHEYLLKQYEMLKQKEMINESILDYIDRIEAMIEWNKKVIVKPEEEGK